jgi:RHS repeat-associated protein
LPTATTVTGVPPAVPSFDAQGDPSNPTIGTPYQCLGAYGSYADSETGLVLLGQRYYDPAAGRFVTRDPIGQAGGIYLAEYLAAVKRANRAAPGGGIGEVHGYGYTGECLRPSTFGEATARIPLIPLLRDAANLSDV